MRSINFFRNASSLLWKATPEQLRESSWLLWQDEPFRQRQADRF
jgi:hypothetical protein